MEKRNAPSKIAIVTGASAGLGVEFALQLERSYFLDEVWLVARRADPMKEVSERFHKSEGKILPLDLTSEGDMNILCKKIRDEKPEIRFLVNNAGYGAIGPFSELGLEEQLLMIDLNVRALTHLTRVAIPFMGKDSNIVQVASSIAYCPAPFFNVYAATKSYVLSFSEALNFELKDRGIHVIAVCPGPVATEFFTVAQKNQYMKDKVGDAEPFNNFLSAQPRDVVIKALSDMEKKRRTSIYGIWIKLFSLLIPFVPRWLGMMILAKRKI